MKATLIGVALAMIGLFITLFLLAHCEDEGCTTGEIECDGATLVICNADGDWDLIVDCRTIEPGAWTCCEVDAGADCCEADIAEVINANP
jgi:hypothetical protein